VRLTPLGDVRLGANNAARPEKLEPPCPECNEIHRGECCSQMSRLSRGSAA
jgi:hypothetical protein